MDAQAKLYTRSEIASLTAIEPSALNYWSREGLLIAAEGGSGKGRHRRFDFVQVNIAVVLAAIRSFGVGIGALRLLADTLQSAAELGAAYTLHPSNYTMAARLADRVHAFSSGEEVLVRIGDFEERPANLCGTALGDWLTAKRPAVSEDELIFPYMRSSLVDYDSAEKVIDTARAMKPGQLLYAEVYRDLITLILAPTYASRYSWLLFFAEGKGWRFAFGDEDANFSNQIDDLTEGRGPGIFLPVSEMIRKTWSLPSYAQSRIIERITMLTQVLAAQGISAKVSLNEGIDGDYTIETANANLEAIEVVLKGRSYITIEPGSQA